MKMQKTEWRQRGQALKLFKHKLLFKIIASADFKQKKKKLYHVKRAKLICINSFKKKSFFHLFFLKRFQVPCGYKLISYYKSLPSVVHDNFLGLLPTTNKILQKHSVETFYRMKDQQLLQISVSICIDTPMNKTQVLHHRAMLMSVKNIQYSSISISSWYQSSDALIQSSTSLISFQIWLSHC